MRLPETRKDDEVLSRTSTENSPWYVVPADRKWYRNLVVAETVKAALLKLEPAWPQQKHDLSSFILK